MTLRRQYAPIAHESHLIGNLRWSDLNSAQRMERVSVLDENFEDSSS